MTGGSCQSELNRGRQAERIGCGLVVSEASRFASLNALCRANFDTPLRPAADTFCQCADTPIRSACRPGSKKQSGDASLTTPTRYPRRYVLPPGPVQKEAKRDASLTTPTRPTPIRRYAPPSPASDTRTRPVERRTSNAERRTLNAARLKDL